MQSMMNRDQSPIDHSFVDELATLEPKAAAKRLECLNAHDVATILVSLSPVVSEEILLAMADDRREEIISAAPAAIAHQWAINFTFPEDSIGRLLDPPHAVFRAEMTVEDCIERIRKLAKKLLITYGYIVDPNDRLIGVVAMRDLLLSKREVRLSEIMLRNPFFLRTTDTALEAMKLVVNKHFPVYPVCDGEGKLIGTLRGPALFEQQVIEISAQVGKMMGLEKEERLSTPLVTSFRFRHPWLQLNLLTAFVAAGVVGYFQTTIDKMVVLAVFLPVLAGQSGNTGCQSLAVTLRGLTLGELKSGKEKRLVFKEGLLGLYNGALVGVSAGLGMYVLATWQDNPQALQLGLIVLLAMIGSCIVSGVAGALIPLILRRLGADPATSSSIFLTTATDVASMGFFLSLASLVV